MTPLALAVSANRAKCIAVLLEKGAEVGPIVVAMAAQAGNVENIEYFVKKYGYLDAVGREGMTPIHYACEFGKLEAVKKLVELGANVEVIRTDMNMNPANAAAKCGHIKIVKYFLNERRMCPQDLKNAAIGMVKSNDLGLLEQLVQLGVNLHEIRDAQGDTLMHTAAGQDKSEVIEAFARLGMDTNARGNNGIAPLAYAAYSASPDTLRLLLKLGAEINHTDDRGCTAISQAGKVENLQILLDAGADVNLQDKEGIAPLHAFSAQTELPAEGIQKLVENGANIEARTNDTGYTPLLVSAAHGHLKAFQILLSLNANLHVTTGEGLMGVLQCAVIGAAQCGNFDVVEECLRLGIPKNGENMQGKPLAIAASCGHIPTINYFLSLGAHIDEQDVNGDTALHHAVEAKKVEAVQLLLQKGASKNLHNKEGKLPIDFAPASESELTSLLSQ